MASGEGTSGEPSDLQAGAAVRWRSWTTTASGRAVGAAGKYSWNVHRKTRLYAKLGIHSWKTKMRVSSGAAAGATDADGTDAMGGLGVEYTISDRVRILAGSDNYITEDDDVSLTYVGLRFGFN